ncbi:neuronal acetylcholine receptor subunit alpha-5-like isoform X1 [Microplitis mediator]|uniref:neuronal acetylcholine receptor subunit alpha-5-like isoform X1 n=1 Tax=Microplitis mediator TaxID=375433 RepID=UPI002554E733|nr:neuronal acetylcholine receptor subunit alpha-5-like isoform X1 [Microplitis mediator]XP_057329386.1 neuronal acetylcholine receptor subunit alpha-5-like isoform X1 [Microplitis mediator]XP_057329387.1 neuronal acetylcholine receptor subunit alpha-5-like isoform X1 [Microplitis mediator]
MLKIIIILILIIIKKSTESDYEPTCNDIESKSADLQLRRHLFCDYDPNLRPSLSAHSTLNVDVRFIPKFVDFSDISNSIDFHTWLILTWDDVHLHWNPDEFAGITLHHVKSNEIWIPDFTVFNSGDLSLDQSNIPLTDCILSKNGTIQCAISKVFTAHCPADFSDWPYDNHNCTLHFGSWLYFGDEINYHFEEDAILMDEFVQSHEWNVKIGNLTKSSEIYETSLDSMVFMNVEIRRRSTRGILIYITPAIVLSILTVLALCLDFSSPERTTLISTNFICHIYCIFDLHWYLPSNNAVGSPKILIFYETSLIITAFTFIFSAFMRKIYALTVPTPQWIVFTVSFIYNCPIGQYLKIKSLCKKEANISNDTDNQTEQLENNDTLWMECVNLLELLAFVSIIITYIILLGLLTPATPRNIIELYVF